MRAVPIVLGFVVAAVAATVAHAERIDPAPRAAASATRLRGALSIVEPEYRKTRWNLLGTRVNYGAIREGDRAMSTMAIAFSIDRAMFGTWRVFGEYEYLWLGPYDVDEQMKTGVGSLPDSGHRMHAGLRRRLAGKSWLHDHVGAWIDGEIGGGAMVVDREGGGVVAMPHAFLGARAGMSLLWSRDDDDGKANADRWDYEIVVRGMAMPDGFGVLVGIGLAWGD